MTKNTKREQAGSTNMQETGLKKVSIESIKKTRMEKLTPWLSLIIMSLAVVVSLWSVYWSVTRASDLAKQNIKQQKISWALTLLSQLTGNNPDLQKSAATTFAALYKKGTVPNELLPALQEAAGDPKTNPDAVRILRNLLGSKRYSSIIQLGTNIFNCLFPISLDNRRFLRIGSENGRYFISTIVSDDNVVDFEIVNNVPRVNSLSNVFTTKSGTLVVNSLKTGDLIYKVDVGSEITVTYKNQVVKITEDRIVAGGTILTGNSINAGVGVILFKDGGSALGGSVANIPKNVMELYKRASDQNRARS
jgi:hypothetical protein